MRALVVDDSKTIRTLLSRMMVDLGFTVTTASDGLEALQILESGEMFEVVLVDNIMPRMNGVAFIKTVREKRDWDQIKLIMVTGDSSARTVVQALRAGADEFMMKPVDIDTMDDKISHIGIENYKESENW